MNKSEAYQRGFSPTGTDTQHCGQISYFFMNFQIIILFYLVDHFFVAYYTVVKPVYVPF